MTRRWVVFALTIFAVNFGWEMAQSELFANMKALPFWIATRRCFIAAVGDLVIVAVAFTVAAVIARNREWPLLAGRHLLATMSFFATGLAISIAFERWAVATGRWHYDARMPVIFGLGVSPLLQWVVVPLLAMLTFRLLWSRNQQDDRRVWNDSNHD